MLKKIGLITVLIVSVFAQAELVNVNPDKNGEPWNAGGLIVPENFSREQLNFLPNLTAKNKDLPSRVDNSLHKYFRPVFNQVGGSCAQASGVGYTFTYEIDRLRDLAANSDVNQYPTHFTYDFLNGGSGDNGSWWSDGWDIIKSAGIMNVKDYGGSFATGGSSRWISGIEEWSNGTANRVATYNSIDVGTPAGLETLKNWFDNHLEDSEYGGVSVFAAGATGYTLSTLPSGTHEGGKKAITRWGVDVNHAMTYIGYDDSVRFDYNGDGKYTNDKDINGDRKVDMRDWEIGAVIVANSWGTSFGDDGKCYQMYKLLAEPYQNGGIFYSFTDVVFPAEITEPSYLLEIKMKHTQRDRFKINAGVSQDIAAVSPNNYHSYPFMYYQGGAHYPQGGSSEEDKYIDFTLDISDFAGGINSSDPFKVFFMIDESDNSGIYHGEIISIAVIDKQSGRRYYNTTGSVTMVNNGRTTVSVIVDENTFVPENLTAYGGDGIVKLEWNCPYELKSTQFESFRIYRNGELFKEDIDDMSYTDTDVVNGELYTYKVSAMFSGTFNGEIFSYTAQTMPSEPSELPYFQNFEDNPCDMSFENAVTGWMITDENSMNSEFCDFTGNSTKFLGANPDLAGNYTVVQDYAVLPLMNLSSYDNVKLSFDYILSNYNDEYYYCDISILYRTGLDQEWIALEMLDDSSFWTNHELYIPSAALASNSTQLAFYFDDYMKWAMGGGGIDNISLTGEINCSAPAIVDYLPSEDEICLTCAQALDFSITIEDSDTGPSELIIEWYVNEILSQTGGTEFSVLIDKSGIYNITVKINDKYSEVSKTWELNLTDINEIVPLTTKIYQNYPNPFNPSTVIRFDNSREGFVELNVYNSNGQLVKTLANGVMKSGSYSFSWDGKNNNGTAMASGIYYFRISADNYVKSIKALLFK